MVQLQFSKAQASGNDYLVIIDPDNEQALTADQIRQLLDRHTGVGATGIIRAVHTHRVADAVSMLNDEPDAQWYLDVYDNTAQRIPMCGDAIRIMVHTLIEQQRISPERRDTVPVATPVGIRDVLVGAGSMAVDLGRWRLGEEYLVNGAGLHISRPGLALRINEQHVVVALSDDAKLEGLELSRPAEIAPVPDEATCYEFVVPEEPFISDGVARIRMRVQNALGVEQVANGNAAAAAALAFRHWGGSEMPNSWSVVTPTHKVSVRMYATEEGEHVSLSGPVHTVFQGTIDLP